ncbi:MAG: putative toxin-antitoxin system toxin component, PIN family [Rubrivivax sp.]|nr:putative toxin-antitoxin system toxin component, PIN family [Rubrivivax sp.]
MARQSLPKSLLVYSATPTSASQDANLLPSPEPNALAVVLDTNTVLDWLVFRDAGMAAVASAVQAGTVRWLACSRMRDELSRTLTYPTLAKWGPNSEQTLTIFDRHATLLPTPTIAPLHLRCSDTDDQVFLDLALAHRASWLLTHDRALLRLARRARAHGLQVTQPRHWQPA